MNHNRDLAILNLFQAYLSDQESFEVDEEYLKYGIYIGKDASFETKEQAKYLWGIDSYLLNQTFHKSLETVLNKSYEQLLYEQIIHYFTTYGLKELGMFDRENIYIPKEQLTCIDLKENLKFRYIRPISENELTLKVTSLAKSNIALSPKTINDLKDLMRYIDIAQESIDSIQNKEVKNFLYKKYDIVPQEPTEFVRYMVYELTNETLLIKDLKTITALRYCNKNKAISLFKRYDELYGYKYLAQVFNRYKRLFIALKSEKQGHEINTIINKISHLSKKHHKPMPKNDMNQFVVWYKLHENDDDFKQQLLDMLEKAGMFQAIKLLNYLYLKKVNGKEQAYKIRNGKVWINYKKTIPTIDCFKAIEVIEGFIVEHLKTKVENKVVCLDECIELVLPQSEKQYIGCIPFASYIEDIESDAIVGIHWTNIKYGERETGIDLDLKVTNESIDIGWNSNYRLEDNYVFSGDMTDAPIPYGASEFIYIKADQSDQILSIKVNEFSEYNDPAIKFEFYIAKSNPNQLIYNKENKCYDISNYVVDPNEVMVKVANLGFEVGKLESNLGYLFIQNQKIQYIFYKLGLHQRTIATDSYLEAAMRKFFIMEMQNKCLLKTFLMKANAQITYDPKACDFDFRATQLKKDTLINLFQK